MAKHTWTQDAQCGSCNGTGLYVGVAERDGAAVVCYKCKGTGKMTLCTKWEDFEGLKERTDVARVLKVNPGVCVGTGDGKFTLEMFGGMPYVDWLAGDPFPKGSEMRAVTCPRWWAQSAGETEPKDEHEGGWCCARVGGMFSGCKRFPEKAKCWEQWDRDQEQSE